MPQFDPTTMAPQIVWLLISFAIFYFMMARVVLPKIGGVIEERSERIADDLDQAEQLRVEGEKVQDDFQGDLADARAEAQKILADARAKAQKQMDEKSKALDAKLSEQAEQAEHRIVEETKAAMAELESVAAEVAQNIVTKLLDTDTKAADVKKAVKAQLETQGNA
ncbi:MAG: hypothetical protein PVF65_09645 [Sphingomonadales bacterium]|jgi:F-type H+-transporting ATPase subunit b